MRTIEKNQRKQESTSPPFSIGAVLKTAVCVAGTVAGFCTWGVDFVWALVGVFLFGRIIKDVARFLLSLVCLIGFIYFIFTYIF